MCNGSHTSIRKIYVLASMEYHGRILNVKVLPQHSLTEIHPHVVLEMANALDFQPSPFGSCLFSFCCSFTEANRATLLRSGALEEVPLALENFPMAPDVISTALISIATFAATGMPNHVRNDPMSSSVMIANI